MLPRVAIVDPELTYGLPPAITASTGLDALTQLIEPFISVRANPMTDALCREAIPRAARSLRRACAHPRDADAREDLAIASLFGGHALANAGLGAVHGCAAPIGGMFPAPHGAVCAALLPHVMRGNLRALGREPPGAPPSPASMNWAACSPRTQAPARRRVGMARRDRLGPRDPGPVGAWDDGPRRAGCLRTGDAIEQHEGQPGGPDGR